jgi:transposase
MRETLRSHPDFANEKSNVEHFLSEEKGHIVYLLPKYHCELNRIERVWAQAKRYSKAYCKYKLLSLHTTVVPALESVKLESIQKHFRKVRHYVWIFGRPSWRK